MKRNQNRVRRTNGSKTVTLSQARKGRAKSNGRAAAKTAGDGFSILQVELDDPTFQRVKREAKRLGVTPGEFCEAATAENLRKMGVEVPDNVLSTGARRAIALVESANTHGSAAATAVQEAGGASATGHETGIIRVLFEVPHDSVARLSAAAEKSGLAVEVFVSEAIDAAMQGRKQDPRARLAEVLGLDANESKALGLIAEWEREPLAKYCRIGLDLLERSSLDQMQMVVADKTEGKEERAVAKRYLAKVNGLMPPKKRRAA